LMGSTLFTNLSILALGIVASVVINRSLGPSGKGVYATLMAVSSYIVLLAGFGINKSAVFFMADPEARQSGLFQSLLPFFSLNLLLALLFCLIFDRWLAPRFFPGLVGLFFIPVLALSLFQTLNNSFSGVLRGLRFFNRLNLYNLVQSALSLLGVSVVIYLSELSPGNAVFIRALSFLLPTLFMFWQLQRLGFQFTPSLDRDHLPKIAGYGLGIFAYSTMQNLNYRFDVLLLATLTTSAEVGWYSTGVGLAELVWQIPTAVGLVLLPMVIGAAKQDGDRLVARSCRWSLFLVGMSTILLLLLGQYLVVLLYSAAFLPSVPVLGALAVGIVANGLFQVLGTYFLSEKLLSQLTLITALGFLVNLAANLVLIPRLGIMGAGIASSISYTITGLITATIFHRRSGIRWRDFLLLNRADLRALFTTARTASAKVIVRLGG
jgi:O-antigen/teichoic acid export membrane protein